MHVLGFANMYASGFIPSTLTTFEREFGLSSLQASTIVTGYTIAKLFLGVDDLLWGKAARAKIPWHNMLSLWLIRYSFSSILREVD